MSTSTIKFHRVKHLPTGLYYQPGNNNLSENGKIYHNNNDVISANWLNGVCIRINKTSKVYLKHKEVIDKCAREWRPGQLVIFADAQTTLDREMVNVES